MNDDAPDTTGSLPVTVVLSRHPVPGREDELVAWADGVSEAAAAFPGHLGAVVYPPSPPDCDDLVIAFSFASAEQLSAWERSEERRSWLDRSPLLHRAAHLATPGELAERGVEGATGERARGADHAPELDRPGRVELLHGEERAEVVRDRVEATGMHDPGAGADRGLVVGEVHPVDELGLAGEVDVVGAGRGARGDQRLAVLEVGADRRDDDLRGRGHLGERGRVRGVGVEERQVRGRRVERREAIPHRRQLLRAATGQRPPQTGGRVLEEVLRGQATGEAGRTEEDDVVGAVSIAGHEPMLAGPRSTYARGMCRNIRPLNNFEPPATNDEVAAAALQYVRKVSGTTKPSQANQEAFDRAVREIAHITEHLLDDLVTTAPPKNRDVEAAKARARAELRYAR